MKVPTCHGERLKFRSGWASTKNIVIRSPCQKFEGETLASPWSRCRSSPQAGADAEMAGVTPVQELAAAGVTFATGSDNSRDPFYAFGDLDALEALRETIRICHLDPGPGRHPRKRSTAVQRPASRRIVNAAVVARVNFPLAASVSFLGAEDNARGNVKCDGDQTRLT
jgi:hypothetical protein